jgi:hypothetical protein
MKCIHPKLSYAAALAALALSATAGCKNPSGGVGNPFLAPSRVPPPTTRALLPGEAQPYYPGDPLPVMQSRAGGPGDGATLAATEAVAMPSATENLKWGSSKGAPQSPTAASAAPSIAAPPEPAAIAATASAEPSVAVPADGGALRFAASTPPEPQPFIPTTASPVPVQPAPSQLAATPRTQNPQTVVPASYNEPLLANAEQLTTTPWRSPELSPATFSSQALTLPPPPAPSLAPTASVPTQRPITAPPLFVATNTMDVRLRAVPSPPVDTYSPTPRIRIPGNQEVPYVGSNDGFRPRSSMR